MAQLKAHWISSAAQGLGELRDIRAVPPLLRALDGAPTSHRPAVVLALTAITGERFGMPDGGEVTPAVLARVRAWAATRK